MGLDLSWHIDRATHASGPRPEGRVHQMVGMLAEIVGMRAAVGTELAIKNSKGSELLVEVLGFRDGRLLAAPLGSTDGVEPGAPVVFKPSASRVEVGEELLGRVIDAFGDPMDGGPRPRSRSHVPLRAAAPPPFSRRPIDRPVETGVRAMDALLPLGRGQRIGLFAGTGVGKSTLLGMLCRHAQFDVIVVGLIGERGREVGDFVRNSLGEQGLARSVVVAATSDASPFARVRGALRATAIAEHFRSQGKHVLLVMDSVTRFAMALREASLAAGEPPLTKGYTPSVFAALPALLERAGTICGEGSITAVYTVLVEGDDLNDPIADAVRGILDGHIVLSRKLADKGIFPAIDILKSVSRLQHDICSHEHLMSMASLRDALACYSDAEDLIQIGAYVAGSDSRVDRAKMMVPAIESFVRQGLTEMVPRDSSLGLLMKIGAR